MCLRSCGIPSRPPVAARPLTQLAEYSVNAHKSGVVQSTDFLKARIFRPWFLQFSQKLLEGDPSRRVSSQQCSPQQAFHTTSGTALLSAACDMPRRHAVCHCSATQCV
jgi:hypothetical protein